MGIGTGLLLGSIVLSLTLLYINTKNRWRWGLWIKRGFLGFFSLALIGIIIGVSAYYWDKRPREELKYWGIPLNTTKADVRFLKGDPTNTQDDDRWTYTEGKDTYVVYFASDTLRLVANLSSDYAWEADIQGIKRNSSTSEVVKKFGTPSYVSTSEDGLMRVFSYEKFNTAFWLKKDRVVVLGMYDPEHGPIELKNGKGPKDIFDRVIYEYWADL